MYGEIPLIERTYRGFDGREHSWFEYDLTFEPTLPIGTLRGDVSQQEFCSAHHAPKYFYVDEQRICVQCGENFQFTATEQKYWYEALKFNFRSTVIRCRSCRKKKRTEKALRRQIGNALEGLIRRPRDPHLLLDLHELQSSTAKEPVKETWIGPSLLAEKLETSGRHHRNRCSGRADVRI